MAAEDYYPSGLDYEGEEEMATRRRTKRSTTTGKTGGTTTQENTNIVNVGAVWFRETKKGDEFLSIVLDPDIDLTQFLVETKAGERIILSGFVNSFKEEDKHPDYNVVAYLD